MTFATSDTLHRTVLLGAELIDPVTLQPVCRGIGIAAVGLHGAPVTSWSGRFAWLDEPGLWPTRLDITPGALPYEAQSLNVPLRPASGAPLLRVLLRPTVAYPFGDGMTVARGHLREDRASNAAPIPGARVWLAWTRQNGATEPAPADRLLCHTDASGQFAACLRLPAGAKPVRTGALLAIAIMVEHDGTIRRLQRDLPDGQLCDLSDALAWSDFT